MPEPERVPRRRDAEATKLAILDAAREAFGEASYDNVGLRDIASRADVDVALIGRYFGSKEELFATVIAARPHPSHPPPEDRREYGAWLARIILASAPKDPTRFLLMHHSVANERAAAIIRTMMTERFIRPMGAYLGGPDGELRAAMIMSQLSGLGILRHVLRPEAIENADREKVAALLAKAIQAYVPEEAAAEAPRQ